MANLLSLLQHIEIDHSDRTDAQTALNNLWPVITKRVTLGAIPGYFDAFATGSYARGTKNSPLDDIDIFYVFGKANRAADIESYNLTDVPFVFSKDFYGELDCNLSSIKVINLFKRAIAETYSRSDVARDGECLNIFLDSYSLGFDLVPALFIENKGYYAIPKGSGSEYWKPANPIMDEKILTELDKFHGFTVRNVIRIAKYWFRKKRIRSPRSYHLEALIYHLFYACKTPIRTLPQALDIFFQNSNYLNYLFSCPDPTGFSEPLSSRLDWGDVLRIVMESTSATFALRDGEVSFARYIDPAIRT